MTTTVAQLIAALQKLPQDAEVEAGYEHTGSYYTSMYFAPLNLDFAVADFTSDTYKDSTYYYGKVIVSLEGCKE